MRSKQLLTARCMANRQTTKYQAFTISFYERATKRRKHLGAFIDSHTTLEVD